MLHMPASHTCNLRTVFCLSKLNTLLCLTSCCCHRVWFPTCSYWLTSACFPFLMHMHTTYSVVVHSSDSFFTYSLHVLLTAIGMLGFDLILAMESTYGCIPGDDTEGNFLAPALKPLFWHHFLFWNCFN